MDVHLRATMNCINEISSGCASIQSHLLLCSDVNAENCFLHCSPEQQGKAKFILYDVPHTISPVIVIVSEHRAFCQPESSV